MARYVKQRRPPIVAISFAFLFIVASGLAILFYNQRETEIQVRRDAEDLKPKLEKRVDALKGEISGLTELILGSPGSSSAAEKKTMDIKEDVPYEGGLVHGLEYWHNAARDYERQLNEQKKETKLAREDQITTKEEKDKISKSHEERLSGFEKKVAVVVKQQAQEKTMQDENSAKEKKAHAEEVTSRDQVISKVNATLDDKRKFIQGQTETLKKQDVTITKLKREITPNLKDIKNPGDGAIIYVPPTGDAICYVDLGKGDGVHEGMTFMIFPQEGTGVKDFKGSILITDVRETFSICKVTSGTAKVSDKVANLAFDKARKYRFVIIGDFDLTGKGVPTSAGRAEVREAISLSGAIVEDALDVQTDFMIVGFRPRKPIQPPDNAPDERKKQFEDEQREYKNFDAFQNLAKEMNVVKIDTVKFLTFTGYLPRRKPK